MLLLCILACFGKKITVDLKIDTKAPVSRIDDLWACVTLDWWPENKCDYGNCPWGQNSVLNIDTKNAVLVKALQAFDGQFILRIGGSLSDFVVYKVPPSTSSDGFCNYPDFSPPTNSTKIGYEYFSGCLEMSRWDTLNEFCAATRCNLVFGLNALYGRTPPTACVDGTNCRKPSPHTCCTAWEGLWDPINAEALVRYSKDKGYPIYALELGNELVGKKGIQAHISVDDYLQDWKSFVRMIDDIYGSAKELEPDVADSDAIKRPLTIGPDTSWMGDWISVFLLKIGLEDTPALEPDIVSHHIYSMGAGVNSNAWIVALNVTVMDTVATLGKEVHATVRKSSPHSKIIVGEAGGFYNSGANNVTNAFNSGFWFLDQMAVFAAAGHNAYCRQTLSGGFYGLLDGTTYLPNPDYFSLLAWTKLMGREVLNVAALPTKQLHILRSYAHCLSKRHPLYKPGALVTLLINTSNSTHVKVNIETDEKSDLSSTIREDFIFSSACGHQQEKQEDRTLLACRTVLLNGQLLDVSKATANFGAGIVGIKRDAVSLILGPLTYGFVVFPEARAEACTEVVPPVSQ